MLDMAILGLLEERDLHGYEIRRQLREHLGLLANVSFGSIYPALTRLEKSGAVVATEGASAGTTAAPAAAAPPTGSLSGERAVLRARRHSPTRARRGRKVYRITDSGRALFVELLEGSGATDDARSFGLRLAFARHLAPQARLALLERRRALLVQRLGDAEAARTDLDVYARSVVQHTADGVARDISWLDSLIASERAAPCHRAGGLTKPRLTDPEGAVSMPSPIRLAIAGVGNCASSLVQGITYYRDADPDDVVPGLMHVELGGYHVRDLLPVAAFDVDQTKVGTDLGKAIHAGLNNTVRFAEVGELGVTVQRGPTFDGLGLYYRELIEESPVEPVDVAAALREAEADVLVSYLPVGSEQAQRHYAQACLDAGVAFVNAIPVFIASDPEWARKFRDAGVPIVGDDIKSQVGSTIVHRILTRLFEDRGLALDHTYQLNFGGNMDFKNMLERKRLESKKISKTQAVTSQLEDNILDADDVHVGPSDHVPWLKDRKWAYIRMEGRNFGDVPLNLELKLEVWDSPNSAGVIIDAVRCAKLALDRGIGGPLLGPSAYFMKSPPVQYHDDVAHTLVEEFAAGGAQDSWPAD